MLSTVHARMMVWTFVLVIILGGLNFLILARPPTRLHEESVRPRFSPQSVLSNDKVRSGRQRMPNASEPSRRPSSVDLKSSVGDLRITCPLDQTLESYNLPTFVKHIRIIGTLCKKGSPDETVATAISNETNGILATVFFPQHDHFTSDYIPLTKGANRIRVEHIFADGKAIKREILVTHNDETP